MKNNKKDILIFIGCILILGICFTYYYHFVFIREKPALKSVISNSEDINNLKNEFDQFSNFDYEDIIKNTEIVGGGEYKDDDFTFNLPSEWMLNKDNVSFLGINLDGNKNILLSAAKLDLKSSSSEIFEIKKNNSFAQDEYVEKIIKSGGEILKENEDGSFIIKYKDSSSGVEVYIIEKIFEAKDNFIYFSYLTINSDTDELYEKFNNLLDNFNSYNSTFEVKFLTEKQESLEEDLEESLIK